MSPCAFRSKVGNFEVLFEGECGRHDFPINRPDGLLRENSLVHLDQLPQQCIFPVGRVYLEAVALLDQANLMHEISPLRKKFKQLLIDCIDFISDFVERHFLVAGTDRCETLA